MKTALLSLVLSLLVAAPVVGQSLEEDLKKLQGTWTGSMTLEPLGQVEMIMEVKDKIVTITLRGPGGDELIKFKSEFKLEKAGKFSAMTYFNAESLSDGSQGQQLLSGGETRSSIYRFSGSELTTVAGFDPDDETPPALVKWKKK